MSSTTGSRPLVRISKVGGRYLLFDIEAIMFLRRNHNICSAFVGTIPQAPQQNIFMGLPLEMMPEEAQVLVDRGVAYVVDDGLFHTVRLASLDDSSRKAYLQFLESEGRKAQMASNEATRRRKPSKEQIEERQSKSPRKQKARVSEDGSSTAGTPAIKEKAEGDGGDDEAALFDTSPRATTKTASTLSKPVEAGAGVAVNTIEGFGLTPTTSTKLLSYPFAPPDETTTAKVDVPPAYPLYAHLQDRGYYMMPGLRFGCDYTVYPGDPLRYHSHFQATHYGWEEEINMLDIAAGGRLGTNVKKGYLIGGAVEEGKLEEGTRDGVDDGVDDGNKPSAVASEVNTPTIRRPREVRTFCIEWAAM